MLRRTIWIWLLGMGVVFGGKNVVPAVSPVVPVSLYNGWYLGIGFNASRLKCGTHDCPYEDTTYGVLLRGGYDFSPYFGAELRALRTYWGKGPYGGAPLQHVGIFLKPMYPLGKRVVLYALAGYAKTWNRGHGNRLRYFDRGKGLSLGGGVEYRLPSRGGGKGRWRIFVDYQRLLVKKHIAHLDSVSVGIRYDF